MNLFSDKKQKSDKTYSLIIYYHLGILVLVKDKSGLCLSFNL